jgi:L-ribulose-5-phosphate 4-epimerase
VLVAGHGPFAWGADAGQALEHALALEIIAQLARDTVALRPEPMPLPEHIRQKHFARKHGPAAYYGQER